MFKILQCALAVTDSKEGVGEEGGCSSSLTGYVLKQVKVLHENALFCIKISNIFCREGIAPSPYSISYPPVPYSKFLDPPLCHRYFNVSLYDYTKTDRHD